MNNVYFACLKCKIYIDAGYRWAYWSLEHTAVVEQGKPINVDAILQASQYWNVPADGGWPTLIHLQDVRKFLSDHARHELTYGDDEKFLPDLDSDEILDWLEIGSDAAPTIRGIMSSPDFHCWEDVVSYFKEHLPPWWFENPRLYAEARKRFVESPQPIKAKNAEKTTE